MRRGTNGPRVGTYNRTVVLSAIRESDGVSRVELAERTGLTQQAVSNIVRRLLADRLVVESDRVQGEMGKPRTMLRINRQAYYAIGVHVDPQTITAVAVDLAGHVVARARSRPRANSRPATVVNHIVRLVDKVVKESGAVGDSLLGVGIASPGALDVPAGEVLGPPNLPGWGRVPLRDAVAARVGLPVLLDNDTTAAAVGERWVGRGARTGSFAFIYLGTGIGCGLVLADQVLRGESGNAGELGHMTLDIEGPICHCGNRGCLEAYIAPAALNAQLRQRRPGGAAADLDWAGFAEARASGDVVVAELIDQAADRLADAAVGLVNLLDLPLLVIGGQGINGLVDIFCRAVDTKVNTRTLARGARHVQVLPSVVGESVGAIGAASLVLHSSYSPHLSVLLADVP